MNTVTTYRYFFLLFLVFMGLLAFGLDLQAQTSRWVTISPKAADLEVACGDTVCVTITIAHVGDSAITFLGGAIPNEPFEIRNLTDTFPRPLAPFDTLSYTYCFVPVVPGVTQTETLVLRFDTLAGALPALDTIRLTGTSLSPDLVITPASIDFGNVTIGQTSCRTVEIRNNGNMAVPLSAIDTLAFPFSPTRLPNVTLGPGEALSVEVCFSPIVASEFQDGLMLENGDCRQAASLVVNGRGLNRVANIGPVLQVLAPAFDTTLCGTTKCRTLTFRNVGTDPLSITELDELPPAFSGAIGPLPIVIPADDERTFTVCYAPTEAGRVDSAILNLTADNRVSLSIATLYDISGSMGIDFGGTPRIAAANAAGIAFLGNLINDPARGVQDEGAVFVFGAVNDIARRAGFSTNIPALQTAVPSTVTAGTPTCLYDGVIATANDLATRNEPGRRVMVVLADGANSCPGSSRAPAEAIAAAQAAGIRIYTIGIGAADAGILTSLAEQTGGFYSEALTPSELLESYQTIANSLSRDQRNVIRFGARSVAPELTLSQTDFAFGEVRVGQEVCRTLTVTNTGDAPLSNVTMTLPDGNFRATPATLPTLEPGSSSTITLCFRPGTIRELATTMTFGYRRCDQQQIEVDLDGYGYDTVTISLDGAPSARPGSTVDLVTRLLDNVPESYRVDSIRLRFRYNKTMLYPADEAAPFLRASGIVAGLTDQEVDRAFGQEEAFLDVAFASGRLVNTSGPGDLGTLRLLVLHGNALSTPVELVEASFADGNPRVGITGAARFDADSLCFHEDRLVDGSALYGPVAKLVSLSGAAARVSIEMPEDEHLQVALFDINGRLRGLLQDERQTAGLHLMDVDLEGLEKGVYLLQARTTSGRSVVRVVVR